MLIYDLSKYYNKMYKHPESESDTLGMGLPQNLFKFMAFGLVSMLIGANAQETYCDGSLHQFMIRKPQLSSQAISPYVNTRQIVRANSVQHYGGHTLLLASSSSPMTYIQITKLGPKSTPLAKFTINQKLAKKDTDL